MIKQLLMSDLIKERLHFDLVDARGFHCLKCQVCNDYKIRAGFKFDGDHIGYNCWNCGTTFMYEEGSELSKKARRVLNSFGLDDTELSNVVNSAFFNQKKNEGPEKITLAALKKINTATPSIQLPPKSFKLIDHADHFEYQEKLVRYLVDRKIDPLKYQFFYSLEERYLNRVIIPFYRGGKLIYWQARHVNDSEKKRYENAMVPREAVMFNMDALTSFSKIPLFVTEGVFDALPVDGVALLGSKLTDAKKELLSKTTRRLIFVIDKDRNGAHLAKEVLSLGWEITFAPNGADDVNKSIQRFGKIWTIQQLFENIPLTASEAQLAINMKCI